MTAKKQSRTPRSRQIGLGLLILAGGFFLLSQFRPRTQFPRVPYSLFIKQVEDGQVEKVLIGESEIRYQLKGEEEEPGRVLATTPIFDMELPKRLEDKGVEFFAPPPPKNGWLTTLLYWVIPPLIMILGFRYFLNPGGSGGMFSLNKNKAKVYVEGESQKITFLDVAGVEEAKIELQEIVEILKNPDRFNKIGARIPKGILLVGPPGTGKTLLAKAVAGEAEVAFLSLSASEFMELLVGTGAARVRDLFAQAKKSAPCIIFIDELDAIGKSRSGRGASGSHEEQQLTLNQLLTEMDGFSAGEATVMVLAATNRPETLDPALLRPGRFDRQVLVDRPDVAGRLQILKIYGAKVKLGKDVDLPEIATQTPGFVGADLANLANEAALLAARDRRETVAQKDFKEAIERVIAGLEKKSRVLNAKEKKVVAYHEVGHALVGALMPGGGKVAKISIVPRGIGTLGYTLKMPTEDRFLLDDVEFQEQIATLLGGRAAEEIVFGRVTNGAADDLQRATILAEKMVATYGMSRALGPLAYNQAQTHSFLGDSTASLRRLVSEKTAEAIDDEVKALVEAGHDRALAILKHNRNLLEAIAQQLLTSETIEGAELQKLLERVQPVESMGSPIAP